MGLDPEKFKDPDYVIRMGFYRENDTVQEEVHFYFSHWYMSKVTLFKFHNIGAWKDCLSIFVLYSNNFG